MKASEKNNIVEAVGLLDVANDEHWEADGAPKLGVLKELTGKDLTAETVKEALDGATRIDLARAKGVIMALPEPPELDVNEIARKALAEARSQLDVVQGKIDSVILKRAALDHEMNDLIAQKDKLILLIEKNAPQVEPADIIKRIQAQSMKAAQDRKNAMQIASAALAATGISPQFASPLDAALAMRKKTPQDKAAMANYIRQNAVDRNAARG